MLGVEHVNVIHMELCQATLLVCLLPSAHPEPCVWRMYYAMDVRDPEGHNKAKARDQPIIC